MIEVDWGFIHPFQISWPDGCVLTGRMKAPEDLARIIASYPSDCRAVKIGSDAWAKLAPETKSVAERIRDVVSAFGITVD